MNKMNLLILVRHGLSEWNKLNIFTGWHDPGIIEEGWVGAWSAGRLLKDAGISIDTAFQSDLLRAQQTLQGVLEGYGNKVNVPTTTAWQIKERDYGDLAKKNKDEIRKQFGDEQFLKWRRSYSGRPPGGESLEDCTNRVLPYFQEEILPKAAEGKNVVVAAHGNSIRSMIKFLDQLDGDTIATVEIPWTIPIIFEIGADQTVKSRSVLGYTDELAKKFPYFPKKYNKG